MKRVTVWARLGVGEARIERSMFRADSAEEFASFTGPDEHPGHPDHEIVKPSSDVPYAVVHPSLER